MERKKNIKKKIVEFFFSIKQKNYNLFNK
jgi:hypothetical protein